jgi:hypothetical protein
MKYVNVQTGQIREFDDNVPIPEEYRREGPTTPPMLGKKHTESAKKRIGKLNAEKMKGKHWYTNGVENRLDYECPDGYTPGRTK